MKSSPLLALLALTSFSFVVVASPDYSQTIDESGSQANAEEPTSVDDFVNFGNSVGVSAGNAIYEGDENSYGASPPSNTIGTQGENGSQADIPLQTAIVNYGDYPFQNEATSAGVEIVSTLPGYDYTSSTSTQDDTGVVVGTPVDDQYSYGDITPPALTSVVSVTTTQITASTPCIKTVLGSTTSIASTITAPIPTIVTQTQVVTNDGGQVVSADVNTVRTTVTNTRFLTDTLIMCRPVDSTVTNTATETNVVTLTSTNVQQTTETVPVEVTATVIKDIIQTVNVQENFTETLFITSNIVVQQTVTSTTTDQVNVTPTDVATSLTTVFVTSTQIGTEVVTSTVTVTEKSTRTVFGSVTLVSTVTEFNSVDTREPTPTSKPCTKSTTIVPPPPPSY